MKIAADNHPGGSLIQLSFNAGVSSMGFNWDLTGNQHCSAIPSYFIAVASPCPFRQLFCPYHTDFLFPLQQLKRLSFPFLLPYFLHWNDFKHFKQTKSHCIASAESAKTWIVTDFTSNSMDKTCNWIKLCSTCGESELCVCVCVWSSDVIPHITVHRRHEADRLAQHNDPGQSVIAYLKLSV